MPMRTYMQNHNDTSLIGKYGHLCIVQARSLRSNSSRWVRKLVTIVWVIAQVSRVWADCADAEPHLLRILRNLRASILFRGICL